jgi:para-aminobenzoate synthetase/4-amino-4-deoxychorismate lyase
MMRNDIGRVARVGTVSVPELFTIERYPTVWQMTSRVTAETDASLEAIVAALHPSASVTGAPKVRTMEILADLEPSPRGVYTGAIGYVAPGGDAQFNVAIRTAVVDLEKQQLSFGVGSGIVWDSSAAGEYDECLLKAAVLGRVLPEFDLLETMRWSPANGVYLLERHLRRLRDSAEYFGFSFHERTVADALERAVSGAGTAPGATAPLVVWRSRRRMHAPSGSKRAAPRKACGRAGRPGRGVPVPQDDETRDLRPGATG